MKIFLAATSSMKNQKECLPQCKYFLESFLSIKEWQMEYFLNAEDFLLDSGAYTLIMKNQNIDLDLLLTKYIDFINKYKIKHFFEFDFDNIVGYQSVVKMRRKLEYETQRQCIPVWHISRGKERFLEMCEEYDYVAIGDIAASKNLHLKYHNAYVKTLSWFVGEAHKRKTKIHGLGFTQTTRFGEIKFDTVDSSTWVNGGRYGNYMTIKNGRIVQNHIDGKRVKNLDAINKHNFLTWCEYQRWAERNL